MDTAKLKSYLTAPSSRNPVWLDQGGAIGMISSRDGSPRIWEMDLVTGAYTQRTFGDERIWRIIANPADGSILFCMDVGGNEREQVYLLPRGAKEPIDVTKDPGARHFLGGMTPEGEIVYASNTRAFETFDLWAVDPKSGVKRMILQNGDHYNWPAADGLSPSGQYLLYNKLLGQSDNALWMVHTKSGKAVRVPNDARVSAETMPAWRHDEKGFYVLTDREGEFVSIAYYDLASGSFTPFYKADWDVETIALSADDRYLAAVVNEDGYSALHLFDLALGGEVNASKPPKGVLNGYGTMHWSPAGHRLLFTVVSGKRLENVWMLDLDQDEMRRVTESMLDGISADELVEPSLHRFASFDGLSVPYWLYVPHGKEAKDLPIVVEIHGGPEGQELPMFDAFIQYLVGEGIAVVAPNVRGSTGYGNTYTHLDDVEKRLDSVRDIDSLVAHLIETGVADKDRLAVSGMSYGGFMTLSCATRYPHLWACAVDTVGMYNLESFLENTAEYRRAHRESEYGTLARDREVLRAVSPIAKVDDITAPLMVVHGRNDPRVPVSEAEQVVAYLRKKGLSVAFICYDDEGHGIWKLKNRMDLYPKVAAFLKEHMKLN